MQIVYGNITIFSRLKARFRLEIEIGLEFNQLEEREPISSLMNFFWLIKIQYNLNL